MFHRYQSRRIRGQKGFTLIELGIVIAVIAILATVVLMGRGFLEASRVSKVIETINTVGKGCAVYAGANGGVLPNAGALMAPLVARNLVPAAITNANFIQGFTLSAINRGATTEQWTITIACTTGNTASCQDLCTAKCKDGSLVTINGAAPNCATCAAAAQVIFAFRL